MAECEQCGKENGYRKKCPHCGRRVCRVCNLWGEVYPQYFCCHGTVRTISLNGIKESRIKKVRDYLS